MQAEDIDPLRTAAEAQRLEQAQAEHRALVATLLNEHREMLRAQADAAAAKQDQIFRELLAEHRVELGGVLAAQSEHIRDLLAQHREQEQRTKDIADYATERHEASVAALSEVLAKQTEVQARDHEQTAQQIDNLSSFIGDLTQTISLLAMTTFAEKPEVTAPAPPQQMASPTLTSVALPTLVPTTAPPEHRTLASSLIGELTPTIGLATATPAHGPEGAAPAPSRQATPPAIAPGASLSRSLSAPPGPEPHTPIAPMSTDPAPAAIPTKQTSCTSAPGSPHVAACSNPTPTAAAQSDAITPRTATGIPRPRIPDDMDITPLHRSA